MVGFFLNRIPQKPTCGWLISWWMVMNLFVEKVHISEICLPRPTCLSNPTCLFFQKRVSLQVYFPFSRRKQLRNRMFPIQYILVWALLYHPNRELPQATHRRASLSHALTDAKYALPLLGFNPPGWDAIHHHQDDTTFFTTLRILMIQKWRHFEDQYTRGSNDS